MKTITSLLMLLAITAHAQFRLINGRVYSLTDSQAGWTVFSDPMCVRGFDGNDLIVQCYKTDTINDRDYYIGNQHYSPTHTEKVYGQEIILKNYPNAQLLGLGGEITGPIKAMRVNDDAAITSGSRAAIHTDYENNRGYSSSAHTTIGGETSVLVYDMGVPYIPPARKLSADEIVALNKKRAAQDVITFNWLYAQATNGSSSAQCSLGEKYLIGKGTETNRDEAIHWLRAAANQGDEEAASVLQRLAQTNSVTSAK